MSTPQQIITELLSSEKATTLDRAAHESWQAAAGALAGVLGSAPGIDELEGRLVMPEEVSGDFADPHIVSPLVLSANGATASAYLVVPAAEAATLLGGDPEQPDQTIAALSAALAQAVASINAGPFANLSGGASLAAGDLSRDGMPALLGAMDEPALALTGTLRASSEVAVTFLFPSGFLDLLAGVIPAQAAGSGGMPFTLTREEQDAAGLIDELPAEEDHLTGVQPDIPMPQPLRQPTPISSAPATLRARFAPLAEPTPPVTRHAIDLISTLEMNVSVELGRTEMTISEVLALGPGSVIELDRLSGEPVDILVNDRLIARGEVVVVDENFGVRVVEVVRRGLQVEERAN